MTSADYFGIFLACVFIVLALCGYLWTRS